MQAPEASRRTPVDLAHLRRFTCGDADLEQEILSLFVVHGPECLAALAAAGSPEQWIAAAHSLKGSARAVGANVVADLAAAAEQSPPADVSQREQQVVALEAALQEVRTFVCGLNDVGKRSAAS